MGLRFINPQYIILYNRAIHPGGRAILDRIASAMNLAGTLEASRAVPKDFGNMSSTTTFFVFGLCERK